MTAKIIATIKHGESVYPRIVEYVAKCQAQCNESDDTNGKLPCGFEHTGVSSFGYEKTGAFKVSFHCRHCHYSKIMAIEVQFSDEQNRGQDVQSSCHECEFLQPPLPFFHDKLSQDELPF